MPTDLLEHEPATATATATVPAPPMRRTAGAGVADRRRSNEARCWRIVGAARPLGLDDLDWDAVADTPVDDDVIEALVYMRDVEGFTDRDLVGLAGHVTTLSDPCIAAFLSIWREEEAGHAQALDRFLTRYGERPGTSIPSRQLPPPAEAAWWERTVARTGGPVGSVVAAAHMAWGAANELLTLNGYQLLARRCGHPVLRPLLERIAVQERRHFSFYLLQAEWRLAASRSARFALRRVLARSWTPVGVGDAYKQPVEFARVLHHLAGGAEGAELIARMDRRFAALPGFAGLTIFRDAARFYGSLG